MIRIRTGSRLHFGLFSLPTEPATARPNLDGEPTLAHRHFGGVGLMIDKPGIELTIAFASQWSAHGPLASRALHFAQTYCNAVGIQERFHLRIDSAAPEHAGLGTGTQLGLAVARGIAELTRQSGRDAIMLAGQVNRGLRSALGVHGFDQGGFLVEGGKRADTTIAPLLVRQPFPEEWKVLLITPRELVGAHGSNEIDAFAGLAKQTHDERTTEILSRLVLLGMLPALIERDLDAFGEALYDFNRRVGEMFRPAQGGIYAHPRIEAIVRNLRAQGVKGVGQSSWGPTVFAIAPDEQATEIRARLSQTGGIAPEEIVITEARNRAAAVCREA